MPSRCWAPSGLPWDSNRERRQCYGHFRDNGIILEVSVINWLTAAIGPSISDHPAKLLWDYGIRVQPNMMIGIMGIDLNNEWHVWKYKLGFSDEELDAMQLLGLERSFLGDNIKERLWAKHFAGLLGGSDTMSGAIMKAKDVHCASVGRAANV